MCVACLLQGKAQPQQLMRVGSTLYRRALSFTVTSPKPLSVIRGIEEDGTAQLSALAAGGCDEVRGRAWRVLMAQSVLQPQTEAFGVACMFVFHRSFSWVCALACMIWAGCYQ